jgi:hypothetical protein
MMRQMSTIRDHVREMHPQISPLPRSNEDVAQAHARAHHRLHCSHIHEEDNAGKLIGPGSDRRRPSGWYTGLGVVMRDRKMVVLLTPDV